MSVAVAGPSIAGAHLEGPEMAGYRSLWDAAPPALAARFGIEHADVDGVHCTAVVALGDRRLTTHALGFAGGGATLERIASFYRRHDVAGQLALRDGHPEALRLIAADAEPGAAWTKFARGVEPPPELVTDLVIRPVGAAEAEAMGALLAGAFELPAALRAWFAALPGRPGWHCLGAFDGDQLVGTGSLYAHRSGGWVAWGATHPAHRGRGAQGALLAARIELARRLGLGFVVTETGTPGPEGPGPSYRNILRSGFTPVCVRRFWRLAG